MSAATEVRTALPHKDIAAALDVLAVMFEHADMPATTFPDQAPSFNWHAATDTAVYELAARLGVEVDVRPGPNGCVFTSFCYGIGRGTDPHDGCGPAYTHALVLQVVHMTEVAS